MSEESAAEKRTLYVVATRFFLLALYITWEAVNSLISREEPLTSPVGIILALLSLLVMTALAFAKQPVGVEWEAAPWSPTPKRHGSAPTCPRPLLLGVGAYAVVGLWWADPADALAMLPVILWQGWERLAEACELANHED